MDRFILLMLASILAGCALIKVPLEGTFIACLEPIINLIGIFAILIFSLSLILKGLMALPGK